MFLRVLNKGFLRVRTYESVKFRAYFYVLCLALFLMKIAWNFDANDCGYTFYFMELTISEGSLVEQEGEKC